MLPVSFPQQNFTFGKPQGMTEEECSELVVFKGYTTDGYPCLISKWMPSKEDIEAINRGEGIWLHITGHGHPPVSLYTDNPFPEQKVEHEQGV